MATLKSLVNIVADATDRDETRVMRFARYLGEGDLIVKSSGRRIATMRPRDAVSLLLAVALSPKLENIVPSVRRYRALQIINVKPGHKFERTAGALLDGLLYHHSRGRPLDNSISVRVCLSWPEIIVRSEWDPAMSRELTYVRKGADRGPLDDTFRRDVTIPGAMLARIAEHLAEDEPREARRRERAAGAAEAAST